MIRVNLNLLSTWPTTMTYNSIQAFENPARWAYITLKVNHDNDRWNLCTKNYIDGSSDYNSLDTLCVTLYTYTIAAAHYLGWSDTFMVKQYGCSQIISQVSVVVYGIPTHKLNQATFMSLRMFSEPCQKRNGQSRRSISVEFP